MAFLTQTLRNSSSTSSKRVLLYSFHTSLSPSPRSLSPLSPLPNIPNIPNEFASSSPNPLWRSMVSYTRGFAYGVNRAARFIPERALWVRYFATGGGPPGTPQRPTPSSVGAKSKARKKAQRNHFQPSAKAKAKNTAYLAKRKADWQAKIEASKAKNEEGHQNVRKTLMKNLISGEFDYILNTDASLNDPKTYPENMIKSKKEKDKMQKSRKYDAKGAICAILRDKTGNPVYMKCKALADPSEKSSELECDAVIMGIETVLSKEANVLIQTDNQSAVTIYNEKNENQDHKAFIKKMDDYHKIFANKGKKFVLKWVPRHENLAADQLTKLTMRVAKKWKGALKIFPKRKLEGEELPNEKDLSQIIKNEKIVNDQEQKEGEEPKE